MDNSGSQPGYTPPNDKPYNPSDTYTPQPAQQQPPPQTGQPTQYIPPQSYMPPPGGPPPMPPQQEPARKKSPLLLILGILGGVIVLCVVGIFLLIGGVFAVTQPVVDAGDAFMTALRDGNYSRAYDLSSSSLQQEVGNAEGLEAALSFKQPESWSFNSRSINNNEGRLSGTTKYKAGDSGTVEIDLTKIGNDWKVVFINLR